MTKRISEIYEKFVAGDNLTTLELKAGLAHFDKAAELLLQMGPVFTLAFREANRVAQAFEGFIEARARK